MTARIRTSSITWGKCQLIVEGLDMRCPLCGVDIPSGNMHECKRQDGITTQSTRPLPKGSKP